MCYFDLYTQPKKKNPLNEQPFPGILKMLFFLVKKTSLCKMFQTYMITIYKYLLNVFFHIASLKKC